MIALSNYKLYVEEGGEPSASVTYKVGVKPMNHIHPVLKAKREAVNAPAIEVTKLLSVNQSLLLYLYNFRTYFAFPISDSYIFFQISRFFFLPFTAN